ncbi:MAG: sulfotransferase [Candidatus Poribacteria bacterium]|nr:sulfotransferase [Candidatus Poribacteria bacterium]
MIAQIDPLYIRTRPTKVLTRLMSYAFFEGRPVTTKGRWINPLVFSILKTVATNNSRYKPVEKPIFILGTGRSGTTILGIVLSMHREVGYLNEPKAMWHLIHPYEDVIGNYSQTDAKYRLTAEDATDEMHRRASQMFGAYLTATRSQRLVDKYPELIFRVSFVRALFPDARFIFLVRNGWDTCHSIATWSERLGVQINGEKHDWWGVNDRKWRLLVEQLIRTDPTFSEIADEVKRFERHLDRAAVEWILTMQEGIRLRQASSDYIHLLRFEELTLEPDKTLAELCDFCELSTDSTFRQYARQTLHPVPARQPFDVHPKIAPIFHDTMRKLRYNE